MTSCGSCKVHGYSAITIVTEPGPEVFAKYGRSRTDGTALASRSLLVERRQAEHHQAVTLGFGCGMPPSLNYSKWDHIGESDDEDAAAPAPAPASVRSSVPAAVLARHFSLWRTLSSPVSRSVGRSFQSSCWRMRVAAQPPPSAPLTAPRSVDSGSMCSGLPHLLAFIAGSSSPDARRLIDEAKAGRRCEAIRIFFEGVDGALKVVADEQARYPSGRDVRWRGTSNSLITPEERWDFREAVECKVSEMLRLGRARSVLVRPTDSGLFACFLGVLDNLLMAPPEAEVLVDWRLEPTFKHFTYWPLGPGGVWQRDACVWRALFDELHRPAAGGAKEQREAGLTDDLTVGSRHNFFFGGRFRWRWRHSSCHKAHRRAYHALFDRWISPAHPAVVSELADLGARLRAGVSIGVHKRVDTPGTAVYQGTKAVPSDEAYANAIRAIIRRMHPRRVDHLFLATDDLATERYMRAAFGAALHVRPAQRVAGGVNRDGTLNEVHIASPHNPKCSLQDAVDVLADALLLASCGTVLHMDSNVSTAVAIMSEKAEMVHVEDVLESLRGGG